MASRPSTRPLPAAAAALAAGAAVLFGACGSTSTNEPDLIAGKRLFVEKCGSCHVLNRAATRGTAGPNLDQAFQQAIRDGMPRSGVRGMVYDQILEPSEFQAEGDKRADGSPAMPADLVTGRDAENVAAYVASVVARPGRDTGLLATAVKQAGSGPPAVARRGVLSIESDPTGQLAYVTSRASASAGPLTVQSPNRSGTPHNIVIDGKGKGAVVQNGGVSEFSADFDPGTYTYYCSVPGHREGGMQGRLTVK